MSKHHTIFNMLFNDINQYWLQIIYPLWNTVSEATLVPADIASVPIPVVIYNRGTTPWLALYLCDYCLFHNKIYLL